MPTRHELWCVTFGCVIGLAVGGSLVWAIQSPPPEWYRLEHVADWFVASFTGLLAYVTFRLVMSTNRLWKESERQYKLSEDTARRQLRAYVHPREASLVTFERGLPLYVMIPLFNTGQTPAHDLKVYFELAIKPLGDKDFSKVTSAFESVGPLGAGQRAKSFLYSDAPLTRLQYETLKSGDPAVFVWGHIEYRDIFDDLHFTYIRLQFEAAQNGEAMLCLEGNSSN